MSTEQEAFLSLSIYLTGFDRIELMGTGMLEEYYQFLLGNIDQVNPLRLWTITKKLDGLVASKDDGAVSAEIQRSLMDDPELGPIAKNIIRLWYTGSWRKVAADPFSSVVASAQAYQEGLVWNVMQTHPPGAKQPGFGTWSELPR